MNQSRYQKVPNSFVFLRLALAKYLHSILTFTLDIYITIIAPETNVVFLNLNIIILFCDNLTN